MKNDHELNQPGAEATKSSLSDVCSKSFHLFDLEKDSAEKDDLDSMKQMIMTTMMMMTMMMLTTTMMIVVVME